MERYEAMLCAEWDGKAMLYSDSRDEYYSDTEAAHDDLEDGESIEDLRLVICEPNYARQIDKDFFCDEMTEDGDLPHEVINAMSAFNKAISGIVLSWFPGRRRLKITEQEQGK